MAKKLPKRKDARLNSTSGARRDRRADNREAQSRELSDNERLEEFRKSFYQSVLPDLPKIPGYHVCWLTTNNPADSIHRRMRLGYEAIKASDLPGYDVVSIKTGEYAGCIGVNEMIAFKIPLHLWEAYMAESHHHQPLAEESKLKSVADQIREEAAQVAKSGARGIVIIEEEGNAELGQDPGVPVFADAYGED